jgi:hypothetical protein
MSINQNADSSLYDRLDRATELALTTSYQQTQLEQKDKTLELQEQTQAAKESQQEKEFQLKVAQLAEKREQRKTAERIAIINPQ